MTPHLRTALRNTAIAAVIAIAYLVYVFGQRWSDAKDREREEAKKTAGALHPAYTGEELKIMSFYASPPQVAAGGKTLLCYGVLNAATVRITPEPGDVAPSLSRCFEVVPRRTTEYRLAAVDKAGKEASESLTVTVR